MVTGRLAMGIANSLRRARGGNVAMLWALMGAVLVGLVGISIDFTRAQMIRSQLQDAADSAALAAARNVDLAPADREAAARAFFEAEAGDLAAQTLLSITPVGDGGYVVGAEYDMPVSLARLVSTDDWTIRVESEALQSGVDLEVSLVLDITGSMSGTRISDLRAAAADLVDIVVREEQEPFFSKVALVPYSNSVNVGAYATQARGAATPGTSITGASWQVGSPLPITGATRSSRAQITSAGHGLQNGEAIWISGVSGMYQLNNNAYTVANVTADTFELRNAANTSYVSSTGYNTYSSGGSIRRCQAAGCRVVVSSNNHGLADDDYVYITGVNGMTEINTSGNSSWRVDDATDDTFSLQNSVGPNYDAYTSGGTAYCTEYGCEYRRFTSASGGTRVFRVSTCVSERTGANAYTDASPSGSPVGMVYAPSGNPCPGATITPLTSDRALLTSRINDLNVAGSTAGHIGIAWGWYMISPSFGGALFSGDSSPLLYGAPHSLKIAVLMTDGEFNTPYCSGVIAADAGSGSGSSSDHINCTAANGSPFSQAAELCEAMKDEGVIVYTVGFGVSSSTVTRDMLRNCATTPGQAYMADNGDELRAAFREIALAISQLRLSR